MNPDDFFAKPEQSPTQEMKDALARAYSMNGFRSYLIRSIQVANQNVLTCLDKNESELAKEYSLRIKTLQGLLDKSKQCYTQMDEVKKKRKQITEKSKMAVYNNIDT